MSKEEWKELTTSEIERASKRLTMPFTKRASYTNGLAKELLELMEKKESNLVVAADQEFKSEKEIFKFAKELAPEIVGFKFHPRIYEKTLGWFYNGYDAELFDIAKEGEFTVINDTKLGDIGKIIFKQLEVELANAHMVTTHEVQGYHALEAINDMSTKLYEKDKVSRGAISLLYMTSEGHMFDPIFDKLIDDTNQYKSVGGVVAGKALDAIYHAMGRLELGILIFSPGIKIKGEKGERGQTYGHPFHAVSHGTDVIIVGSGIYGSDEPVKAAREYRREGWEGYQARLK